MGFRFRPFALFTERISTTSERSSSIDIDNPSGPGSRGDAFGKETTYFETKFACANVANCNQHAKFSDKEYRKLSLSCNIFITPSSILGVLIIVSLRTPIDISTRSFESPENWLVM